MRKILILGQSVTAVKAVEQIRALDQESEIAAAGFFSGLPALKERFPEWAGRQVDAQQAVYKNEKFYQNLRVEILSGKKISRVNFNRRTVFFDDKSKEEADILVIAEAEKDDFSGIKGANRDGVFSLRTADQIIRLQGIMGRIETVIIESASLRGVMFAKALLFQNKEVIFCMPEGEILPGVLDQEISSILLGLLEQSGVRVIRNDSVKEVLGDDDVKAARLNMGKVIACEAVLFPDAMPDLRPYNRGELQINNFIQTDALLRTQCEGVFAIDEMTAEGSLFARSFDYEALRQSQAGRLAAAIAGLEYQGSPVIKHVCMNISGRELVFIGDLCPQQAEVLTLTDESGVTRARIFLKDHVVVGAFLVDNTAIGNLLLEAVKSGEPLNAESSEITGSYICKREDFQPSVPQQFICDREAETGQNTGE